MLLLDLSPVSQFNQSVFIGFRAEERQVEDVLCSTALNTFCLTDQFFRLGRPHLSD